MATGSPWDLDWGSDAEDAESAEGAESPALPQQEAALGAVDEALDEQPKRSLKRKWSLRNSD